MRRALAWAAGVVIMLSAATAASGSAVPASSDWRRVATVRDRARLREWRSAWMDGLAASRAGDGGAVIAADPALFDPDRSLTGAMPPAGDYRCRLLKLGAAGVAKGFTGYPWGRCRVEEEAGALRFVRLDGPQRPSGFLFADTDARAVFLGAMVFSDEARALDYGRDRQRDLAGVVERIGHGRWRLVLPRPSFDSTVDLVELVPEAS